MSAVAPPSGAANEEQPLAHVRPMARAVGFQSRNGLRGGKTRPAQKTSAFRWTGKAVSPAAHPGKVSERFNLLQLGDSLLERFDIRTIDAARALRFSGDSALKSGEAGIFDPAAEFAPAQLRFEGVKSISFDGRYELNSTVVDFGASSDGTNVVFYFDLTGGRSRDAFLVRVEIVAALFSFGAV